MALEVIGRLGRSGRIVVRDRRDDGSIILLVCSEDDTSTPGVPFLRPESEPTEPPGGFPWPTKESAAYALPDSIRPPFQLTLDTTNLPSGPQPFQTEQLVGRAFGVIEDGIHEIELNERNARDWGWVGQGSNR